MCGITGIVSRGEAADADAVARMTAVLEHRGPDGDGLWVEDEVAFGHRRLAIIDLSDGGRQPMHTPDGRFVITYNGELYNYVELRADLEREGVVFGSASDTEVLLRAYAHWGRDALRRFNGMFAFAIFDRLERSLFVARDRLGVKPLVWCWDGSTFGFASEVKALVAANLVSGDYEAGAVYEYLARGYTSGGRSFFAGVQVLPPGSWLALRPGHPPTVHTWWNPERSSIEDGTTRDEWAERVAGILEDAVRVRLRSDVPVGAHLSGGLDSSAVVAAAARSGSTRLETFTGAFLDEEGFDERAHSRAVASRYGLTSHEVETSIDELPEHFERLVWHMDEPIAGEGVFPQLLVCDLARSHGFIVVLGGQGGDELFGGYLRHRALHYKRALADGSPTARASAAVELVRLAASEWRRVRRTSSRVADDALAPGFLAQVDPAFRDEVRRSRLSFATAADLMWWDLKNYLPALLHVEDRTSMAASIESRTPLLDYRLVELALRIPERMHFEPQVPKPVLRRAVRDWLPAEVAARRDKRGFNVPLHRWRDSPRLRDLVTDLMRPESASDPRAIFAADYLARRDAFTPSQLWSVLSVNGWLRASEAQRSPLVSIG
jgi:asparagine synthase (glutamine-hydrolysing)